MAAQVFKCFEGFRVIFSLILHSIKLLERKYIDREIKIIEMICNSSPPNGRYISARGIPINENKKAPHVGQPAENKPKAIPMEPHKLEPFFVFCESLTLYTIKLTKTPNKNEINPRMKNWRTVYWKPLIITKILRLSFATFIRVSLLNTTNEIKLVTIRMMKYL